MAKQVVARQQGDDYQARWFWLQACSLLDDHSRVELVVYEDTEVKAFDDIVVYYVSNYMDRGVPIDADFYQVKFHVSSAGALTAKNLCDPKFVNATQRSLLQNMKNAHEHCCGRGIRHRLFLYSPWSVDPRDGLARVHSQYDGSIRWDQLAEGGERSKMGTLRKQWKEHLGLQDDGELQKLLETVRVMQGPTLDDLGKQLNWRLENVGLKPAEEGKYIFLYDDLIRKLHADGKNEFTAESLREICRQEGLFVCTPVATSGVISLGIRSFVRWAEDLQNQTEHMACLIDLFAGREAKNRDDWNTEIPNRVACFLEQHVVRGGTYRLHLDTHLSVAYLAGYLLPEKMGIDVEAVQHSGMGTSLWNYNKGQTDSFAGWEFSEESWNTRGTEIALAIGVTHDIRNEVAHYVQKSLPAVGRMLVAVPVSGSSSSSVRDGAHAAELATQLAQYLRSRISGLDAENRLHIFPSAPNGFAFCLGRKMHLTSFWTLYEYNPDASVFGAYTPSISGPRRSTNGRTTIVL